MMPGGGMMGWGGFGGYGGYGMGFVGWLFMLLFWGLIIVGLVLLVRWLWVHGRSGVGAGAIDAPLGMLKFIKRAVTEGLDPDGQPLDWTMPRWQMGDADLNDVLAYLKTLR